MSIKDTLIKYLDDRRTPDTFAPARDITHRQRVEYSSSAASLVEEVFMRAPRGYDAVEICHGESMMLRELFEQIVIDMKTTLDTENIEVWRKKRIEGLERLTNMINGMVVANLLLMRR